MIPITIVCGYFEAGKTSYINQHLLTKTYANDHKILLLSFENGFEEYQIPIHLQHQITIQKEKDESFLTKDFFDSTAYYYDEIWIEYNGTASFTKILQVPLPKDIKIKNIICICDGKTLPTYLNNIEQIMEHLKNATTIYITKVDTLDATMLSNLSYIQPKAKIICGSQTLQDPKQMHWKEIITYIFVIVAICFYLFMIPNQEKELFFRKFFSIILEAFPFVLIAVTLSTICISFLNMNKVIHWLKQHKIGSIPVLILGGMCMPVCDCAMIPIADKMIKKQIPLAYTMLFYVVSSCLNPIVLFTTFYAFPKQYSIIGTRIIISIAIALIIAFVFSQYEKQKQPILHKNYYIKQKITNFESYNQSINKPWVNLMNAITNEFFFIMKFIVIGAFLATSIQYLSELSSFHFLTSANFAFIFLLFASFFLSICASSNAFIAKSFANTFPVLPTISFMIFGPLLDMKNLLILSSYFHKQFIKHYMRIVLILYAIVTLVFIWMGR